MTDNSLRPICLILAMLAILAGAGGMSLSFWSLASSRAEVIAAGQAGFVAGAVLLGSGLVSLSVLASHGGRSSALNAVPRERPADVAENDEPAPVPPENADGLSSGATGFRQR
jgi:hypothetical protein